VSLQKHRHFSKIIIFNATGLVGAYSNQNFVLPHHFGQPPQQQNTQKHRKMSF